MSTMSSMRMASVKASCKPAKRLPSVDWAARPATTPMMPAEARMVAPSCCIAGSVHSAAPTVMVMIIAPATRWSSANLRLQAARAAAVRILLADPYPSPSTRWP